MEKEQILTSLKAAREGEKRKFVQTFELAVNLTNLNLKKGEGKFSEDVQLPHGKGRPVQIGVFAEGELAEKLKKQNMPTFSKADINDFQTKKRDARKIARKYDFLLAQTDLMVLIGKTIGQILGPKGKMPKPLPPQGDPAALFARLQKSVKVRIKDDPVIHVPVGTEAMTDDQVAENVLAVMKVVMLKLPKGLDNLGPVYLKTTMGKAVKIQ